MVEFCEAALTDREGIFGEDILAEFATFLVFDKFIFAEFVLNEVVFAKFDDGESLGDEIFGEDTLGDKFAAF